MGDLERITALIRDTIAQDTPDQRTVLEVLVKTVPIICRLKQITSFGLLPSPTQPYNAFCLYINNHITRNPTRDHQSTWEFIQEYARAAEEYPLIALSTPFIREFFIRVYATLALDSPMPIHRPASADTYLELPNMEPVILAGTVAALSHAHPLPYFNPWFFLSVGALNYANIQGGLNILLALTASNPANAHPIIDLFLRNALTYNPAIHYSDFGPVSEFNKHVPLRLFKEQLWFVRNYIPRSHAIFLDNHPLKAYLEHYVPNTPLDLVIGFQYPRFKYLAHFPTTKYNAATTRPMRIYPSFPPGPDRRADAIDNRLRDTHL